MSCHTTLRSLGGVVGPCRTAAVAIVELDQRRSMAHERGVERGDPIVAWSRVSLAALAAPAVLVALVAAIH